MATKYYISWASTNRGDREARRFQSMIDRAGGIVQYMTGPTFLRSEPTNTQETEKKQNG